MAKLDERIGFIGGGNMAFAIGSGLINRGIVKPSQVTAAGPHLENLQHWEDMGAAITDVNAACVEKSDIIFICVKPHILHACAQQIAESLPKAVRSMDKVFVSVLVGTTLQTLEEELSFMTVLKVVRTMPNTPMQVAEGCTIYSPGRYVTLSDLEKVHLLLASLGIAQQVPEKMINQIGPMTGCGPAFVYTIIEALADGSVKLGVPRAMAIQMAAQTVLGAAKTVLQTGRHPAVLRDEVCSPGGSTIVGVHELERGGLRNTLMMAVEKAAEKSASLGQKPEAK